MKIDCADVPESTTLMVARILQLARDGHSGELRLVMQNGGIRTVQELQRMDAEDLRQLAAQGNGR